MPLVRIAFESDPSPERRRAVGDAVHRALVATAGVPADDLFQVVECLPEGAIRWSPTYLGVDRRGPAVFVQIFLNLGRTLEVKAALYAAVARQLQGEGFRVEDVLVNLVEVPRENWSFGGGVMSYPPAAQR
jgi:4-oxalocrotonate tautomerase